MSQTPQSSLHGWKLWLVWNLVTDVGLILALTSSSLGNFLVYFGQSGVERMSEFIFPERMNVLTYFLISGLLGGFFLGFFQWLIMRTKISRAGRWIWATTIGWAISSSVYSFLSAFFFNYYTPDSSRVAIIALGVVIFGLAQWLVFRREVQKAGWWVVAYIIGFAGSSGIAATMLESYDIFIVLVLIIPGIVTGFALLYLFKRPNTEAI